MLILAEIVQVESPTPQLVVFALLLATLGTMVLGLTSMTIGAEIKRLRRGRKPAGYKH